MGTGMNPAGNNADSEKKEKARKYARLNGIILAGVLVLSFVLPGTYKAFAPLLFLVPLVFEIANKMRTYGEDSANPSTRSTAPPPVPDHTSSAEPYYYKPKDPRDPRRYKPIG